MPNTMPKKRRQFKLTAAALDDLRDIARYTQNTWGKQKRSVYITALNSRFTWLSINPDAGIRRDEMGEGYLCYPEGKHVIFYRKQTEWIEVLGVLYQNMDFRPHL